LAASTLAPSAVTAAVMMKFAPNLLRSAAIRLPKALTPLESHWLPQAFGYSQSMSMPSHSPAQRGSLSRLKQELAEAAGFWAAWVKPADQVQPPKDQISLRPGCSAFSSWS